MPDSAFHVLGSRSLVGQHFLEILSDLHPSSSIYSYSRSNISGSSTHHVGLESIVANIAKSSSNVLISFLPVDVTLCVLAQLSDQKCANSLAYVLCLSSTSAEVKRFSYFSYDRILSSRLLRSERIIHSLLSSFSIPYLIIRPTMIYGISANYSDKNLSRLSRLLRLVPFILLPRTCGYRQPVHYSSLSNAILHAVNHTLTHGNPSRPSIISIGGDLELRYDQMLSDSTTHFLFGSNLKILYIPDRLFVMLTVPLLFFSPRAFEALMRIMSDLNGFTKSSDFLSLRSL